MNKKANIQNIVLFAIILVVILAGGLVLGITGGIVKKFTNVVLPTLNNFPGDNGVSTAVGKASSSITTGVNLLPIMIGSIYFIAIIGCLGLAYGFRVTGEKYLIVPFILLGLLVLLGSIFVSNIYENIHNSGTDLGTELQGMVLLSWLMLYSPVVMTIILFIGGAIIFSGFEEVPV